MPASKKDGLRILLDTHWKSGWKENRSVTPSDFEIAKVSGHMFDNVTMDHDSIVESALSARENLDIAVVSNAFLASLSTRKLELRSALGSFAFLSHFPRHRGGLLPNDGIRTRSVRCETCGLHTSATAEKIDLNVLSFERFKWGGVRHTNPTYSWHDLKQFRHADRFEPTSVDVQIFKDILEAASSLPSDATPSTLAKSLNGVFPSNISERRILIEILGICGILQPRGRTGFYSEFTKYSDREHSGQHFNDWSYPVIWWRGHDGINHAALQHYFPTLRS